tara:strand:+ start:116 stop:394 length:279 start_codon:yes stop_codon:yes gene_type:complete
MLNILKNVDERTKIQKAKVKKSEPNDGSLIPKKPKILPIKGIESLIFSEVIIESTGITDAIEKNSNAPFIINKTIRKLSCFLLLFEKKENNL